MIRRALWLGLVLSIAVPSSQLLAIGKGEFGIRGVVSPFEADPLAWELDRVARQLVADNPSSFSNPEFSNPSAGRICGGVGFNLDFVWKAKKNWKNALRAGVDLRILTPREARATIQDDYYSAYTFTERVLKINMKMNQIMGSVAYTTRFAESQLSLVLAGGLASLKTEFKSGDEFFYFWYGENDINVSSGMVLLGGVELSHHLGGPILATLAVEVQSLDFPDLRYSDFEPPIHLKDLGVSARAGLTIAPGWAGIQPKKKKKAPEPEPEPEEEEEEEVEGEMAEEEE